MISKIAVKRPVTMIMALIAVIILGFVSIFSIPQALLPDIEYPYAVAMVTYSGAGPDEVEKLVVEPMEESIVTIEGVKNIMSISSENMGIVMVEFDMDTDLDFAMLDMREKISMIQSSLPDSASSPTLMKMNMDSMPVQQLYISSDKSLTELQSIIEDKIQSKFERISGVASVSEMGQSEREIDLKFDQDKLAGYGLTMSTISQVLSAENISYPSGTIENGSTELSIKTYGEFQDADEIADVPITLADGSIVTIRDVATIEDTETDVESISRINGKEAIGLYISKTSDANIVEVSDKVQAAIASLEEEYGDEIDITIGYDQADFVRTSINSVAETAVQGAILAVIIIFLFLRNVRSTLVIGISIPTSVLATFCVMKVLGMSLNMLTLGSLTLAIGMVVDNSVVVLENIFRRNKMGLNAENAAITGSQEVVLAVMASTLTSVVVYLPIAFSGGLAGMLFKDFSYTIIAALACSLVVAITVVPMLCSKLLDSTVSEDYIRIGKFFYRYRIITYFTKFIDWMISGYRGLVKGALKCRKRVIAGFTAVFVVSIALVGMVGTELIPEMDEGSFSITVDMPNGTSVKEQDAFMEPIEEYVLEQPEVDTVALSVGSSSGVSSMSSSGNTISVTLVDASERDRSTKEVLNDIKAQFINLTGAEVTYEMTDSMSTSALGSSDLTINVKGSDTETVEENTKALYKELQGLDCISAIETDVEDGSPEVKVKLNRTTAAHYGLTTYTVASSLSEALSGSTSTEMKVDGEDVDIKLSLSDKYAQSVEDMKSILISAPTGEQVPVGQIATFEFSNSPVSINRTNQQTRNTIDLTFKENVDITEGTKQATAIADDFFFDEGVSYDTGGIEEEIEDAFGNLGLALVVSIALVYIVLAAQFESFILPIMVMMSIPFAMSGAFLAMFLTGSKLSMVSFIGLIMLIGIVVNNAILLVEFINQNRLTMGRDDAIAEAGAVRMRPILMTTLTTVIGMLPMALAIGEGTEIMAPMAISIIGGLTASTIITMFLIPVLYAIVDDMETKHDKRKKAKRTVNLYRESLWLAKGGMRHEK